jgi:hypothetical protein
VDEALKHAAEHSDLAAVKAWLTLFDQLMQAERIPGETRRRVLNRCLFGDPRGDVFAKASLDVEAAVAAMDPETLGFRSGEWITSAEDAGWGPVPEKVAVRWRKPAVEHRCDDRCVCPSHDTLLLWNRHHDLHACQDPGCRYAHGLENHPDYEVIELLRRDDQRRHLFEGRLPNPEEPNRG